MPTPKDNGGAAFPRPGFTTDRKMPHVMATDGGYANPQQEGMTLRDWFAGQALAGMTSVPDERRFIGDKTDTAAIEKWRSGLFADDASNAYRHADAMLAERTK